MKTRQLPVALLLALAGALLLFVPAIGFLTAADAPVTPAASAPQDDAAQLADDVRELLQQIRDGSPQEADAAEAKLLELGPKVLEHLPLPNDQMSANVKQRLARVREQLTSRQAELFADPTEVTLTGAMTVNDAFAAIEAQTGNHVFFFQDAQAGEREMEFSMEKMPFWEAMDEIMDQTQLTTYGYAADPGMALMARPQTEAPNSERVITYSGPFRIEATDVQARRSIRNPMDRAADVTMNLSWEPRLSPIVAEFDYGDITVKDQDGQPLATGGMGRPGNEIGQDTSTEMFVRLELPDRKAQKIGELSGVFNILVPGRVETFEYENLDSGERVEKKSAGVTVVLDRVRKNADVWEFRVLLRFENPQGALQSHRNWVYNNEITLTAPSGEVLKPDGSNFVRRTEDEVGMAYFFDLPDGPAGYKLTYKTPTTIMSLPVPFTLRGIPLP